MPHALVTGDPQRVETVRLRLEMLGLTVAVVGSTAPLPATVGACDLVVWVATAGPAPRPRDGELPAAPLLVLGDPRPEARESVAWSELDDPAFAVAVRACVDRARDIRCRPTQEPHPVRYREFLAHELRSPLTVVTMTLQALDEALAEETDPDGARSLVARARRNVQRLARTVDWSQRTLTLSEAPPARPRRTLTLAELGASLAEAGLVVEEPCPTDVVLETDPDQVADIALQMVRTCECLAPDEPPRIQLGADADGCWLRMIAPAVSGRAPRVQRCGLARPGEGDAPDELAELAALLVPGAALVGLDARLRSRSDQPGVLELRLPAVTTPLPV